MLSDHQAAVDYFSAALPAHIADKLDFSTLERQSGSYVSKELEKTVSDVVYTCRRKGDTGSVDVSLLLEHKSAPDKHTPIQVGGYLFSGYQQQIKQGRKQLTPIIPILLYHGRQKWEYWTLDRLFDELGDELLGYIPKFDYVYHNLRDLPEEAIRAVGNQFLVSALLLMKYASDKRKLKGLLPEILSIGLAQGSEGQQVGLVIYGFELVELTEEEIKEILDRLSSDIKDKVMSTYDLLIEKGRKEGVEKGIEKGAEQKSYEFVVKLLDAGKFTVAEIANYATVSEDFVKKVHADLAKKKK